MNSRLDIARLENVHGNGSKTIARCPACAANGGDTTGNHLLVAEDGKFGCVLFPDAEGAEHRKKIYALVGVRDEQKALHRTARTWPTVDEAATACTPNGATLQSVFQYPKNGKPFAAVARYCIAGDKTFRQFHATKKGWALGAPRGLWPLYGGDSLPAEGIVFVVEGELCEHAASEIGLAAVTSAGGSKAACKSDWRPLAGHDVVILPDNDKDGTSYAASVGRLLTALAEPARVRIVNLPGLCVKGDLCDFVACRADKTSDEIRTEIEKLAEGTGVWTPPQPETPPELPTTNEDNAPDPIEAARAGRPYAMTDLGNAERLCAWHADISRFDTARKAWRVWDCRRWTVDSELALHRLAAGTVRTIREEATAAPSGNAESKDLGMALFMWAVKSESRERLAAMLDVAKSRPGIPITPEAMDADPWLFNVLNGTVNLRTGELLPHNQVDLITKLAPVEFHPGRRDERWTRFLHDATGGDAELVDFLQIVSGYTLTGDTSEEKLFLIYGPEAAGKSTFLDALRAVLGDYARTIQADLLTRHRDTRGAGAASPELAGLAGARLAAGSELEQGREIAEALAKNLTGGEPITARHLYAELFDYRPQFKLWLALNHCPKVSADDGAIWRRILRIGFEHTVPPETRDKTLKPYLRNPKGGAPAVLAWAVEGCLRWQSEGLTVPAAVARSTAAYRQESDPLAVFVEDCLRFTPSAWTAWADIWHAYNRHAEEMGTAERFRVAPRRIQDRLRAHDCDCERRKIGRGWFGVELAPDWDGDTGDGDSTSFQSFPTKEKLEKVWNLPSPPSPPSPERENVKDQGDLVEGFADEFE